MQEQLKQILERHELAVKRVSEEIDKAGSLDAKMDLMNELAFHMRRAAALRQELAECDV